MKEFVVFYAWQSDRVERFNRHLIRFALNIAAQAISNDPAIGVKVIIDADTEGVPGHVPVTDTILKKIGACDAFVPDLTFVGTTENGKLIPNPNVMLEYGYALRAKTHSVMMPVMNSAYGTAEKLPFDMGHLRHPVQYFLPATATNTERRAARKSLTETFEAILRMIIAKAPSPAVSETPFQEAKTETVGFFYPRFTPIAIFQSFTETQNYIFDGDHAIYLRLFPKYADNQPRPGRVLIKRLIHDRRIINPMSSRPGALCASNDYGWVSFTPLADDRCKAMTQAFPSGELWGLNSEVFATSDKLHIGLLGAERLCSRTLEHYAAVATSEMKLQLPFVVELGAVGLKDIYVGAPHPELPSGHLYGPSRQPSLIRRYDIRNIDQATLFGPVRDFFVQFYDLADISRAEVLTDMHVAKNDLAPLA